MPPRTEVVGHPLEDNPVGDDFLAGSTDIHTVAEV